MLRDGCLNSLARYPESEEEDAKLMANSRMFASLPRNARMAVKLRRNEKRILLRTIATCESGLEGKSGYGDLATAGFPRGAVPQIG